MTDKKQSIGDQILNADAPTNPAPEADGPSSPWTPPAGAPQDAPEGMAEDRGGEVCPHCGEVHDDMAIDDGAMAFMSGMRDALMEVKNKVRHAQRKEQIAILTHASKDLAFALGVLSRLTEEVFILDESDED